MKPKRQRLNLEEIKKLAHGAARVEEVDGKIRFDFIPHELGNFQTDGLHPIDAGFEHYVNNLWNAMENNL